MVARAGGATVKPDDFYRLYALTMQATQGDNQAERPMWAERGGLDFEGRARWDAWTAVKGMPAEKAKLRMVKVGATGPQYGETAVVLSSRHWGRAGSSQGS
jgi:acyl-CoA-binding protein